MSHSLKVVFRSDVRGIAQAGDVKNVSPGYARNFLFPRQLAFPASDGALRQWETERLGTLVKAAKRREDTQSVAQKIEALALTLAAKASDEGRLFGSVTRQDIKDALSKEGVIVDRRMIELTEPIKQTGPVAIRVHLGNGVQAQLKITVAGENG
jgi:large subunit ribosomal protein L9